MAQGSYVLGEHLAVVDPGRAVPGGRVEDCPEIEECHCGDPTAGEGAVCCGVGFGGGNLDVCAYVVETDGPSEGAVHQEIAAAEIVDEEEKPDKCDDCFDDAENAGCEEGSVGPCYADGAENCG